MSGLAWGGLSSLLFTISSTGNGPGISEKENTLRSASCRRFPVRIMQTILVCLLIISILGSMLSGIILSRHVFYFINIRGISVLAGRVHMTCAYWGFVLMSLHLGIHWRMIMAATGKQSSRLDSGKPQHIRSWILRLLGVAVALYGLYAFVKRNIASYFFLQVHFVFFDYSEPVIFYNVTRIETYSLPNK